ncbi:MAG: histidine-type phosphatase [Betaproteobacteria bacterium]
MALKRLVLAALLVYACGVPLGAGAQSDEVLQKIVIVSRHGVRTPTISAAELESWSSRPWPVWSEPPGHLTATGAQLAKLLGRYHREYLVAEQLLPEQGCPPRGSIYVYADLEERTRTTAQALLDGLVPGCGIAYRAKLDATLDGIFHPVAAGVCRLDAMVVQTSVLQRVAGDLNSVPLDFKGPFDALQAGTDCCKPALCTALGRPEGCKLADLPTMLSPVPNGKGVDLVGALAIASSATEIFLMEYAEGLDANQVAWGRLAPDKMLQTFRLHTEAFDLMERTPYLARRQGSALLMRVGAAVTSGRSAGLGAIDAAVRDATVVAYVGHDTNIANLAGILDVTWTQPGYQRNQTPPGGALLFEVRAGSDKKQRVYTSYVSQSLEQMRKMTPLTLALPPVKTPLRLRGCSTNAPGFPCSLDEFAVVVRNALDRDCVD